MSIVKNHIIYILSLLLLLSSCAGPVQKVKPVVKTPVAEHDILTYKGIDSVLDSFVKVPFDSLDMGYLEQTGYDNPLYRKGIAGKIFYEVTRANASRLLVGKYRVTEFLPKDSSKVQYLCIDREVLYRFLDLIRALEKAGYNKYGFKIKDGYRYPGFNRSTGGARMSQHMFGKAIDLAISDIDGDGKFSESTDKRIVYSLLDTLIIKDSGGLGRYRGTNVVHFDTRGYRARW